jgi:hypothetical protein
LITSTLVIVNISTAQAATNGQAVTWAGTTCRSSANITTKQNITLQTVVEDTVGLGTSYGATIPGGTATLPNNTGPTGGNLTILGFTNLRNTYLFSASAGSVQITNAQTNPPAATAVNNGNPKTFNVIFSNAGTSVPITNAVWAMTGGGQVTFTTGSPHGFVAGQVITTSGMSPSGFNFDAYPITSVTATTFTLTQTGGTPGTFSSAGSANTLTAVTTHMPGPLQPGSLTTPQIDITLTAPAVDSTVTTFTPAITTTANVQNLGPTTALCPIPHANPQSDGISATVVGAGGPTTTSQPACRDLTAGTCASILPVSCEIGAGLPQTPPKPPKNSGLVKISKGLTATPATGNTKWKFTGTIENCTNGPNSAKTGTPVTGGSIQLQVELPPGSTCSNLVPGAPAKVTFTVKWTAISQSNGKPKVVGTDKFKSTRVVHTRRHEYADHARRVNRHHQQHEELDERSSYRRAFRDRRVAARARHRVRIEQGHRRVALHQHRRSIHARCGSALNAGAANAGSRVNAIVVGTTVPTTIIHFTMRVPRRTWGSIAKCLYFSPESIRIVAQWS